MDADISVRLARRLFDRPLIQNSFRGAFVEELIRPLLEPTGWALCSDDWASWDFQHASGVRLELKQSARIQSWAAGERGYTQNPAFSIKEKTGYWSGAEFRRYDAPARPSQLYLFAWHGAEERDAADHRNIDQWSFFAIAAEKLPAGQKSIKLSALKRRGAKQSSATSLAVDLERARAEIP